MTDNRPTLRLANMAAIPPCGHSTRLLLSEIHRVHASRTLEYQAILTGATDSAGLGTELSVIFIDVSVDVG